MALPVERIKFRQCRLTRFKRPPLCTSFYRDTLGFRMVADGGGVAAFSSGRTHHELLLIEIGGVAEPSRRPKPGLYHIGFKIGESPKELKAAHEELTKKGVRIMGASDHGVTHSLYILDPDGNELELYVDVPDTWKNDPSAIMAPQPNIFK